MSITFIVYGTESCSASLSLELVMIMGMYTEHTSVGMLSPSQPLGMYIEQMGYTRHAQTSKHGYRTS